MGFQRNLFGTGKTFPSWPRKQGMDFYTEFKKRGKYAELHIMPGQAYGGIFGINSNISKWKIPLIEASLKKTLK